MDRLLVLSVTLYDTKPSIAALFVLLCSGNDQP